MGFEGSLASYSLVQVFRFLHQHRQSGLLMISLDDSDGNHNSHNLGMNTTDHSCCIWLSYGRIVAVSDDQEIGCLLGMLSQRRWLSPATIARLQQFSKLDRPLGLFLKSKGILQAEQIKLLFHAQVLQRIGTLFKYQLGSFNFVEGVEAPVMEMTGLSISLAEALLLGLRVLRDRDWATFEDKLPRSTSALARCETQTHPFVLDSLERKVWDTASGSLSIVEQAKLLNKPVACIQQVAYRLIIIEILKEITAEERLAMSPSPQFQPTPPQPFQMMIA
ncbi:DUF4388 domain-containing protein [Alkalinema pantanalense CENA528]|uniref:DUF4388 domain-containing protein n=1 Tax=Alkalinema pantanalense TaxID=1620705 RepID=UPI003D6FA574